MTEEQLREAFLKRLTVDSETKDMRRREFNQALFDAEGGWAVFVGTTLRMVMRAYDDAVRDVQRADKLQSKELKRAMRRISDYG
jgi:hypothetical protein